MINEDTMRYLYHTQPNSVIYCHRHICESVHNMALVVGDWKCIVVEWAAMVRQNNDNTRMTYCRIDLEARGIQHTRYMIISVILRKCCHINIHVHGLEYSFAFTGVSEAIMKKISVNGSKGSIRNNSCYNKTKCSKKNVRCTAFSLILSYSPKSMRVTQCHQVHMKTSSNGNIFHVTGSLWGESTCHRWIPSQRLVTRTFDVSFDVRLSKRLSKQSRCRWFETPWRSLQRHCNDLCFVLLNLCRDSICNNMNSSWNHVIICAHIIDGGFFSHWGNYKKQRCQSSWRILVNPVDT